jgi:glycosyltransferase involved in cell wall biosynthesis
MKSFAVSVIIPVYNEEAIIARSVLQAYNVLCNKGITFEIIIVNDGSTDNTANIAKHNFTHIPEIVVYNKETNQGFGSAIRSGIKLSKNKYIFCVPADSPLTEDLYLAFSANALKADIIVSYRREKIGYSIQKHINSYVYHKLISVLFDMQLQDYNWIHMYNRKIFDEGNISIDFNGIFMLAEVLVKAKRNNYTFFEIEVEQTERLTGIATASKFSAVIKTLIDVIVFSLRR